MRRAPIPIGFYAAQVTTTPPPPLGAPFVMTIDTTKPGSAANTFVLPLDGASAYDFIIDWGDGNSEIVTTNTDVTHVYAAGGVKTIEITERVVGGFPAIKFDYGGDRQKVMTIAQWGDNTWASMELAFAGCSNLTITATDEATAQTGSVTSWSNAFTDCTSLTSFPLLDTSAGTDFSWAWSACPIVTFPALNLSNGTLFDFTWYNCTALTTFPLVDLSAGTSFSYAWSATALTEFPAINMPLGTDFSYAWDSCVSLTTFPLIDVGQGLTFEGAWRSCSALTEFPALQMPLATNFLTAWSSCSSLTSFGLCDLSAGTDFESAWSFCSALTSFPAIDMPAGTNFTNAWRTCSSLTTFPAINLSAGQVFREAWRECASMTSFLAGDLGAGQDFVGAWRNCPALVDIPGLDLRSMTNGALAFFPSTLDTDDYSALLQLLADFNLNTGVVFNAGSSVYSLGAAAARSTLTDDRSWTITDGGSVGATAFNPATTDSDLALSDQDTEVTALAGTPGSTFAVQGQSSGKYYLEVYQYQMPSPTQWNLGVCTSLFDWTVIVGMDAYSLAWRSDGNVYDRGATVGGNLGTYTAAGSFLSMLVDLDARTIRFYGNGVALGPGPINLTGPLTSGLIFPAIGKSGSGVGVGNIARVNFGRDAWNYPALAVGASGWPAA